MPFELADSAKTGKKHETRNRRVDLPLGGFAHFEES